MLATKLMRLFTFIPGVKVESAKVNAELDQLVSAQNKIVDDLADLDSRVPNNAYVDELTSMIQGVVMGQVPDSTITPAKLSFDPATQVELDVVTIAAMLKDDIKGTTQIPTITEGVLNKLEHKDSFNVIQRTDSFDYSVPTIITETRTLRTGETMVYRYHTDTLQVEVI